jgi:hypothetical protein
MSNDPKPFWLIRVILLIFFGVPGAFCAACGGAALGAALFGPERDNTLWIVSLLFLVSPVLLLGALSAGLSANAGADVGWVLLARRSPSRLLAANADRRHPSIYRDSDHQSSLQAESQASLG